MHTHTYTHTHTPTYYYVIRWLRVFISFFKYISFSFLSYSLSFFLLLFSLLSTPLLSYHISSPFFLLIHRLPPLYHLHNISSPLFSSLHYSGGMSEDDRMKRQKSQSEKRKKLINPLFFVSAHRLSIRNLAKEVSDNDLKTLCINALKAGMYVRTNACMQWCTYVNECRT